MAQLKLTIATAVVSMFAMGCGISYIVCSNTLRDFIMERIHMDVPFTVHLMWIVGFAYIIPGVVGVISTCIRNKIAYATHVTCAIFGIITVSVIFIRHSVYKWQSPIHYQFCEIKDGKCDCGTELKLLPTFFTCDEMKHMNELATASGSMFWIGGVVTLASFIMSAQLFPKPKEQPRAIAYVADAAYTTVQPSTGTDVFPLVKSEDLSQYNHNYHGSGGSSSQINHAFQN